LILFIPFHIVSKHLFLSFILPHRTQIGINPAARNSPGSDIYGMPILNADQARNVVILKRSMRPGFAGIDNELFYDHRTILLFGDAKESLTKLVAAVKAA